MSPVPILLYHSVSDTASDTYRPWCVAPSQLDEHLHIVCDLGFTVMTVSQFVDARSTGELPPKPCVITFDDGRADFVDGAVPVLQAHGVGATVYVVSGHVGGTSEWLPMAEERSQPMMGWADLRSLAGAGIEVGAHSETHVELDVVATKRLLDEVVSSRDRLSSGLGTSVRSFAYPHGYHSRRVVRVVREAGFDSGAAVKDRWSHVDDDRFALSRMFVWNSTTATALGDLLADPPIDGGRDSTSDRVLRSGWRCTRWARHHARVGRA